VVTTAVGGDDAERPDTGCWCCGDRTVDARLLRLDAHQEVGICFACVKRLRHRMRATRRRNVHVPAPTLWQRWRYRAGFGRC